MKGSNEVENKEIQPEKRLYRRKSGNQDIKRRKWSLVSFERNKIFILLRSKRRSVYRMFAYQVSPRKSFFSIIGKIKFHATIP